MGGAALLSQQLPAPGGGGHALSLAGEGSLQSELWAAESKHRSETFSREEPRAV